MSFLDAHADAAPLPQPQWLGNIGIDLSLMTVHAIGLGGTNADVQLRVLRLL